MKDLDWKEENTLRTYVEDGEEQRKDSDGNLLYLDENNERTTEITEHPAMRTKYTERMRTVEELSSTELARYNAIQTIKETLLKLA